MGARSGLRAWLDPRAPYAVERRSGRSLWWSTSVGAYALAWRLLLVPLAVAAALLPAGSGWAPVAWAAAPAAACAVVGGACALADHFDDEPFGWWGPWTLFRTCGRAFAHAFGRRG